MSTLTDEMSKSNLIPEDLEIGFLTEVFIEKLRSITQEMDGEFHDGHRQSPSYVLGRLHHEIERGSQAIHDAGYIQGWHDAEVDAAHTEQPVPPNIPALDFWDQDRPGPNTITNREAIEYLMTMGDDPPDDDPDTQEGRGTRERLKTAVEAIKASEVTAEGKDAT